MGKKKGKKKNKGGIGRGSGGGGGIKATNGAVTKQESSVDIIATVEDDKKVIEQPANEKIDNIVETLDDKDDGAETDEAPAKNDGGEELRTQKVDSVDNSEVDEPCVGKGEKALAVATDEEKEEDNAPIKDDKVTTTTTKEVPPPSELADKDEVEQVANTTPTTKKKKKKLRPKLTPTLTTAESTEDANDDELGFGDIARTPLKVVEKKEIVESPAADDVDESVLPDADAVHDDIKVDAAVKSSDPVVSEDNTNAEAAATPALVVEKEEVKAKDMVPLSNDIANESEEVSTPSNDDDDVGEQSIYDGKEDHTKSHKRVGSVEIDDDDDNNNNKKNTSSPKKAESIRQGKKKVLELGPYESFSEGESKSKLRTLSSINSQELDDVDLDNTSAAATENSAPLVRAYNGTLNGISPATQNNLSFTFKDSTESEAFLFLTSSLRETLGDDAKYVTDEVLSRYIRYKPDVNRAAARFHACNNKFRKENSYAFDDKPLLLSQDPKLTFLIQNGFVIAPEELFAKDGSGVMIIRGCKCDVGGSHGCDDEDAARAIFYILRRMMEGNTIDPLRGITIILDLSGAIRKNLTKKLPSLLSKGAGCFPIRIQAIYVLSVPWWYPAASQRKLFSTKMRSRIHILKDKEALHEFIEKDRLLEEYGGIYNFDLQNWISSTYMQEVEDSSVAK